MDYSHNFGSNFPDEFISVGTKSDVDYTVVTLINQYYSLIEVGNISEANDLYEKNKETLEPYMINMAYVNRLEEEIYNIGLASLKVSASVIDENEPKNQNENGYWYKDY